jgi:hypothetical protein
MPGLQTSYAFTLPRGYVDPDGDVHRAGRMRLATARDELEPLRDPSITGPDYPRHTNLVLARVIEVLGDYRWISTEVIENLFAVDLAYLQDFYGVINFGTQKEYDALMAAQGAQNLVGRVDPEPAAASWMEQEQQPEQDGWSNSSSDGYEEEQDSDETEQSYVSDQPQGGFAEQDSRPPIMRATVEELPRMAR